MDVSLAFQGGGAKIFALIAAAEVVDEFTQAKRLRVTRLSGTSAGAIVAALLGAGVSAARIKEKLIEVDPPLRTSGVLRQLFLAYLGVPLASTRDLRSFLSKLFQEAGLGRSPKVKDLRIPTYITATNLRTHERLLFKPDSSEPLVDALLDSCGIPFFFRSYHHDRVDGGICDNLPVQVLLDEKEKVPSTVIAFSFQQTIRAIDGPQDFALALLDTAISAGETRARTAAGVSVIELEPCGIGTFDFGRALQVLSDDNSAELKSNGRLVRERLREITTPGYVSGSTGGRLWTANDPDLMDRMLSAFKAQQAERLYKISRRTLSLTLNSLGFAALGEAWTASRIDCVRQEFDVQPSTVPIDSLIVSLGVLPQQVPLTASCAVTLDGGKVAHEVFPVKAKDDECNFHLLLVFPKPLDEAQLSGAGGFHVTVDYWIKAALPGLLADRRKEVRALGAGDKERRLVPTKPTLRDDIAARCHRVDGSVGRSEFVAFVPKDWGKLDWSLSKLSEYPVQAMKGREIPSVPPLAPEAQFDVYGWVAENLPSRGIMAIDVWKLT